MPISGARAGHCGRSAGGMGGVTSPWRGGWSAQDKNSVAQTATHFPSACLGSVCVRPLYSRVLKNAL
jgi:hypothetical protein